MVVEKITYNNFEVKTKLLVGGLVRYIRNVPFWYSPEIISDGIIVYKNGILLIKIVITI